MMMVSHPPRRSRASGDLPLTHMPVCDSSSHPVMQRTRLASTGMIPSLSARFGDPRLLSCRDRSPSATVGLCLLIPLPCKLPDLPRIPIIAECGPELPYTDSDHRTNGFLPYGVEDQASSINSPSNARRLSGIRRGRPLRRSGLEFISGTPSHLLQRQSVAVGVGQPCVLDSSAHVLDGAALNAAADQISAGLLDVGTTRCKPFIVPEAFTARVVGAKVLVAASFRTRAPSG